MSRGSTKEPKSRQNKMVTRGRARRKTEKSSKVILTRTRSITRSQTRAESAPELPETVLPHPSAGPKLVWPNMDPCTNPEQCQSSPNAGDPCEPVRIEKSEVLTPVPSPSTSTTSLKLVPSISTCSLNSLKSLKALVLPQIVVEVKERINEIKERLIDLACGEKEETQVSENFISTESFYRSESSDRFEGNPIPSGTNAEERSESPFRPESIERTESPLWSETLFGADSPDLPSDNRPILIQTVSGPEVFQPTIDVPDYSKKSGTSEMDEKSEKFPEIPDFLKLWNQQMILLLKLSLVFFLAFTTLSNMTEWTIRNEDLLPGFLFDFKRSEEFMNIPDPVTVCISAISVLITKHSIQYFQ